MMEFSLPVVGLLVGLLVGLTGVGGATLLTPILIMLGVQPTIAVGTDLVYNSITKIFGTMQHWRQKTVHAGIALYFSLGSVPGAILAVNLINWIHLHFGNADQFLKKVLGFALILLPIAIVAQSLFSRRNQQLNKWQKMPLERKRIPIIATGAVLGFLVGLTSIGSGSFFAIALMHLFHLSGKEVVGTDIAHAFLLTTAAGLAHMNFGNVHFETVFQLLVGSIPGVLLGSVLSVRIPTVFLRYVISAFIVLSGIKIIM
jgi:uncharacterized membrane protein YfcA